MYNQRNPYIVGTPVETSETFFGRESLLRTIEDSLLQNTKFILLHGQRRIGKSSVLKIISLTVSQDNFLFVYCDLQYLANSNLNEILHLIFTEIFKEVGLDSEDLDSSLFSDSERIIRQIRGLLIQKVYPLLGNKKLVLLLDEFDVVTYEDTEQTVKLLRILENLVKKEDELFLVAVVGRYVNSMPNLLHEVRSLEEIAAQKIEPLLGVARSCWEEKSTKTTSLTLYEQVLQLNPNHFSNVVELAEKYLQVEDFDKALKLYERAYKVDAVRYQQELIQALEKYGHWLITQGNFISAKQQYEKILQIESNNSLAQQKLAEIKAFKAKNQNTTVNLRRFVVSPIALTILGLVGVTGILFTSFRVFNICLPIICVPPKTIQQSNNIENSISSGDRTLFPTILNSARDQGIKSFKEGNYLKAEEYFKKAVNSQRNDPEVLIYLNNALARQRGKPLTLAAVVPATGRTEDAQEMLRGIAQAQNDFNQKDGLNRRLLEIVIADHHGKLEQAEKVAEKLVADASLLGVIGNLTSGVTAKTLPIYEKANLPIISPTSSSTELKSPVFFRTVPSDKVTGAKLAEYAFRNNFKKILIVWNPDDPYSRSITSAFREEFIRQFAQKQVAVDILPNITLPALENMIQEAQNITSNEQPVQAIVFFPDTDNRQNAIEFAKKIQEKLMAQRQNNNNVPEVQLLGGDSLYNSEALDVEGWILAVPWFRDPEKSKNFANAASTRWGGGVSWRTATSFDATQAFIDSFRISTTISKVTVLENLKNVNLPPNETSGEPLMFDKSSRESQRKATLLKVTNKTFDVME
jgi:ABC-type branched-subunit amino acid transport system substrate-binding protein